MGNITAGSRTGLRLMRCEMKKLKSITIFIVIVLLLAVVFVTRNHWYGGIYHNKLAVDLRVQGIRQNLDDVKVIFGSDVSSVDTKNFKGKAQDWFDEDDWLNYVKFTKGINGDNTFEFIVSADKTNLPYDITINLGRYNFNSWYKNSYDVVIYINPNEDNTANVMVEQTIDYYDEMKKQTMTATAHKWVTESDNVVDIKKDKE